MSKRNAFYVSAEIFDAGLSATAIAVFAYLSFCSDRNGLCFPSVKTIAAHCRIAENTVRKAVRELQAAALLETQPSYTQGGNGSRRQSANHYRLKILPFISCTPASREGGGVHRVKGVGSGFEEEINNKDKYINAIPSIGHNGEVDGLIESLQLHLYDDQGFAAAVEYAVRSMYNAESITVSGRRIPQAQAQAVLRQLTLDHIDGVQHSLMDAGEPIANGAGYLASCIYNSVADEAVSRLRFGH